MKITQVELTDREEGKLSLGFCHKMIVWLPSEEHHWKKGMRVELKDQPSILWTVSEVYSTQEHYELNRRWDVGGL